MNATSQNNPAAPDPAPRRILLVTTRSSTLIAVQRALREDRSVQLRFYAHCAAAMRTLMTWRPDALLLDLACAGRTADPLVQHLRESAPQATVALLGDAMNQRLADAIERLGADGGMPVMAPNPIERLRSFARRSIDTRVDVA